MATEIQPIRQEGYDLLHEGAIALAQVEANGIRIDWDRLQKTKDDLAVKMDGLRSELEQDEIWGMWRKRFGQKMNPGSRDQLSQVLQIDLDFEFEEETETGRVSMDEEVVQNFNNPFLTKWIRLEKYKKALSTYLAGIERELVTTDGVWTLHPFFQLHTARSFRSSSQTPNFQNQPTRDKEIAEITRSNFVPRQGCVLVENDFKGIEVAVSAAYHKDPVFIDYISTPGKDMHRDMAAQIYCLDPKEVSKDARYGAKNKFVFPQFYGDFYISCARALWDWIDKGKLTGPGGIPLKKHLKEQGIKELGACDLEQKPRKGTFERHLAEVEDDFWNNRFQVYGQWKKDWFKQYEKRGYFDILSGFRVIGNYKRNQVCNFPVQGAAFHCLLWSLIQVQKQIQDWKSLIVGQIHDSLIGDVRIDELVDYLTVVERVTMQDLPKHWPWLVVSPEIEYEMCLPGGNWFQKKSFKFKNGKFIHPKDEKKTTRDAWLFLETLEQME